mmetsp:Transcript_62838/g.152991  ORF Transcript_62838/g.152991 Transcript_62838/m.152991 type:complete len:583 (+) Transcript_62838:224-1972(+)
MTTMMTMISERQQQQQQPTPPAAMRAAGGTVVGRAPSASKVSASKTSGVIPPVDVDRVDQQLSKAMRTLSFKDRLAVQEEIHGVRDLNADFEEPLGDEEETKEFLHSKLQELQVEIDKIPNEQKKSYIDSQSIHVVATAATAIIDASNDNKKNGGINNSFVNGVDFRLRFLRADLFDAKRAATRLVNFLDFARELFGDFVLRRPVKITDLSKEEMDLLRCGNAQLCPFPDRTGRRVIAYIGDFGITNYSLHLRARMSVYCLWVASESVEVQRKGCVIVAWPTLSILQRIPPMDEHIVGGKCVDTAPVRMTSIHFCISFPEYRAMFKLMRAIVITAFSSYKVRFMFHTGTATVCRYELMTYGVPVEVFPMTETGNIKTKNQQLWLKARREIESYEHKHGRPAIDSGLPGYNTTKTDPDVVGSTMTKSTAKAQTKNNSVDDRPIECPRLDDVCFRYGMSYQWHRGNARFRELLESHMVDHDDAVSNDEKVAVTHEILDELDKTNCRFLAWDRQGWWYEITERNAKRIKIAVAMKEHKKRIQARQNYQQNNSSTTKFSLSMDGKKRKRDKTEDGRGGGTLASCFL